MNNRALFGNTLARVVAVAVLAALSLSILPVSVGRSLLRAQDAAGPERGFPKGYVEWRERQLKRLSVPSAAASPADQEKQRLVYPHQGLKKITPLDNELEKLRKERYNAALMLLDEYVERRQIDPESIPASYLPVGARRVAEAELALSEKPAEQFRARTNYLEFAGQYEKLMRDLLIGGSFVRPSDYDEARVMRLDAEIKLLEAKQRTGASHAN